MKNKRLQYTLREVPDRLDQKLREAASAYGVSLNKAAIAALSRGVGMESESVVHHDMDDLAGTWVQDPEFDKALAKMDCVDQGMWR